MAHTNIILWLGSRKRVGGAYGSAFRFRLAWTTFLTFRLRYSVAERETEFQINGMRPSSPRNVNAEDGDEIVAPSEDTRPESRKLEYEVVYASRVLTL
jgi:hypothetical protein